MSAKPSLLVLRHEAFEHLGYFSDELDRLGIPFQYSNMGDMPALDGHAGIIIMGGPQSANDAELSHELPLIEDAIARKIPVLGICLGAQLIAKALGARVYANSVKEMGWEPVYFTPEGREDALFTGLPSPTTFFHWHGDTFDLPAECSWLAYTHDCRNQVFRYGTNVYGIQFHPEITPEMIVDWSAQPVNCGDVETLGAPIDPHAADTGPLARKVLAGWLGTCRFYAE